MTTARVLARVSVILLAIMIAADAALAQTDATQPAEADVNDGKLRIICFGILPWTAAALLQLFPPLSAVENDFRLQPSILSSRLLRSKRQQAAAVQQKVSPAPFRQPTVLRCGDRSWTILEIDVD